MITVRKGNPEGIKSLDDLLTKDVDVVTPNPFSSGAARWNIMAVYGTADQRGQIARPRRSPRVKTVLEKTVAQPGSARDALAAFTQGEGDVLLGYENEAIKAIDEGEDVEYVVPPSTILIETPIAVTTDAPEPAAEDFLDFIWSDEGQEHLGRKRLPPGQPEAGRPETVPDPEGPVQDQPVRRLGQSQRRVLRRRNRLRREDRGRTRRLHHRLIDGGPRSNTPAAQQPPGRHPPARGRRRPRPRRRSSST